MKTLYRVRVTQDCVYEGYVYVEADSMAEVKSEAHNEVCRGDVDWSYAGSIDGTLEAHEATEV